MRHARVSALLAALLLLALAACGGREEQPEPTPSSTPTVQATPAPEGTPEPVPVPTAAPAPTPEPTPTPTPGPDLSWEAEHRLEVDFNPVSAGALELPIQGATGYASVELPMWEVKPPEPTPTPEATPTPEPTPISEITPAPTPTVAPEATPVPESSPSPETVPASDPTPPSEGTPGLEAAPPPSPAPTESAPPAESESQEEEAPATESPALPEDSPMPEATPVPEGESVPPTDNPLPETPPPELSPTPSPIVTESPPSTAAPLPAETQTPLLEPSPDPLAPPPTPTPTPDPYEGALAVLRPGTSFTVLEEEGSWWLVSGDQGTGWVEHRYCMVNLPDVVPSIIYDAINAYSSRYVSSGKALEGVTGQALYAGAVYNPRLGRDEFLMPVLYSMAHKICQAQQAALAEGNSLILYEGYRPYTVQRKVNQALSALAKADEEVRAGISDPPWDMSWFIAPGYSNHQRGFAIDVGLVKVWEADTFFSGNWTYPRPLEYGIYEMPSPIHELSRAAAAFVKPVAINSKTAWKYGELAEGMNEPALALQRYCTGAGLTPLASEWWHFNDLDTQTLVKDNLGTGAFEVKICRSAIPGGT